MFRVWLIFWISGLILDNAGFELVSDLCLITFLIEAGIVSVVHIYLKTRPWFVSDTTRDDFEHTMEFLRYILTIWYVAITFLHMFYTFTKYVKITWLDYFLCKIKDRHGSRQALEVCGCLFIYLFYVGMVDNIPIESLYMNSLFLQFVEDRQWPQIVPWIWDLLILSVLNVILDVRFNDLKWLSLRKN